MVDEAPINPTLPTLVSKRVYSGFKNYMGLSASPQFTLGDKIIPVFDMSRLTEQTEIEDVSVLVTFANPGTPACITQGGTYELKCPEGFEHIYLGVSVTACQVYSFGLRVMITTDLTGVPTQGRTSVIVYRNLTIASEHILDKTVTPIYVPQNRSLLLEADAGVNAVVSYLRVKRLFGMGPLAVGGY